MRFRPVAAIVVAIACVVFIQSLEADEPSVRFGEEITVSELTQRFRQPADIHVEKTPLPAVIQEIAERYRVPTGLDDSVGRMPTVPLVTLTVSGVNVRQLMEIVATCTGTKLWTDPPNYTADTPLRVYWTTPRRAHELTAQLTWKTTAVDQAHRVAEALTEKTALQFRGTSLDDVLTFFRDFHQIPIHYAGPAEWQLKPITRERSGMSLREGLGQILTPLKLGFVAQTDGIHILPIEEARQRATTRVYSVPGWVGDDQMPDRVQADFLNAAGAGPRPQRPVVRWMSSSVVVTASEEQHGRIEAFVTELRDANRVVAPAGVIPLTPGQLPRE
jgi:hypothetical protein